MFPTTPQEEFTLPNVDTGKNNADDHAMESTMTSRSIIIRFIVFCFIVENK
jgi:hypothetical protein